MSTKKWAWKKRKRDKKHLKLVEKVKKLLPRRHSLSPLGYMRVNTRYPIDFVLANIGHWELKLAGHNVKMWSKRYENFREHGVICVKCGLRGFYFRLERHGLNAVSNNTWHFNLYALGENGEEIMMTKDHIIPKSKGGGDSIENLQTMCTICNCKKSNNME